MEEYFMKIIDYCEYVEKLFDKTDFLREILEFSQELEMQEKE